MSSTAHPHIADFCIDDVVDQNVCRTQSETNAWLSIQLPGESDSTDDPGTVRKEVPAASSVAGLYGEAEALLDI